MTRKPFIAGNWKMNLRHAAAVRLATEIVSAIGDDAHVDIAVCPPAVYLSAVADVVAGTNVSLGAQNLYAAADGAYTGEMNAGMLTDVGCRYVILGHSERRQLMGETDADVAKKLQAAMSGNLIPIVCIGETKAEREANQTVAVVQSQVRGSLAGLDEVGDRNDRVGLRTDLGDRHRIDRVACQAEEVHGMIRKLIGEMFTPDIAAQMRIQYGGSVKANNAAELMSQPNIDGALVGGASLLASDFLAIIKAARG